MTRPPLWPHQIAACDFFNERGGVAYLHHGMGAGKTLTATTLAEQLALFGPSEGLPPVVVILCPKTVRMTWREHFEESLVHWSICCPMKKSHTSARKAEDLKQAVSRSRKTSEPLVVILNYESAHQPAMKAVLYAVGAGMLIVDEAHRIKGPKGVASKFVAELVQRGGSMTRKTAKPIPHRLFLSGTLMPHSPLDVFAQFRALDPTIFGHNFWRFRNRYAVMGGFQGKVVIGFRDQPEMKRLLDQRTHYVGREVLDLCGTTHTTVKVDLCAKARKLYDTFAKDLIAEVSVTIDGSGGTIIEADNPLTKLLRLAQLTGGHAVAEDLETGDRVDEYVCTAKRDALLDLLDGVDPGEPFVVIARFTSELDLVHDVARELGRESGELSGRRDDLEEWKHAGDGKMPILAVQIKAGGTGTNLTRAAYVAYMSVGYSRGDFDQSLARSDRPGQTRVVSCYHIVARNTVDEHIYKALEDGRRVVDSVLYAVYSDVHDEQGTVA